MRSSVPTVPQWIINSVRSLCAKASIVYADLIETGRLDTGSMVSRTIKLDEVNEAFRAMEAGEVTRTVLTFN